MRTKLRISVPLLAVACCLFLLSPMTRRAAADYSTNASAGTSESPEAVQLNPAHYQDPIIDSQASAAASISHGVNADGVKFSILASASMSGSTGIGGRAHAEVDWNDNLFFKRTYSPTDFAPDPPEVIFEHYSFDIHGAASTSGSGKASFNINAVGAGFDSGGSLSSGLDFGSDYDPTMNNPIDPLTGLFSEYPLSAIPHDLDSFGNPTAGFSISFLSAAQLVDRQKLIYATSISLSAVAGAGTNQDPGTASVDLSHTIALNGLSFTDANGVPIPASEMSVTSDSGTRYQLNDPVLPAAIKGDVNRDGHVNAADVGAMLAALSDLKGYQGLFNTSVADLQTILNVDGSTGDGPTIDGAQTGITNADIQALLNLLKNGGGSVSAVPEPTTIVVLYSALPLLFIVAVKRSAARSGRTGFGSD
jgi:hypothetical protein